MSTLVDDYVRRALERVAAQRRLPESTYRLQFHAGFTFRDAATVVPYLSELGVTHVYASPYLRARPGSTHGYDVIDHDRLNPELGTQADFEEFLHALSAHGMSHILDIVPNHVGVGTNENIWWNDVLEYGPRSRFAGFFDIAWRGSPRPQLHDKVLIPVLGDPYGTALENGQLKLVFDPAEGTFAVRYFDRRFPMAPWTYGHILNLRQGQIEGALGVDPPALRELRGIADSARALRAETGSLVLADELHRGGGIIKRRLAALAARSEPIRKFIEQTIELFNGSPGEPRRFAPLHDLLEEQCYRLSHWRTAADEINYRRFFDINDLAALSMERPEVFERTHELVLRLAGEGKVSGLRIDHPDGLYDPAQYFLRLQRHYVLACALAELASSPPAAGEDSVELRSALRRRIEAMRFAPRDWPLYVVAEKILAVDESLPSDWAVHGTSGYDFLNMVSGLFVHAANAPGMTRVYQQWTGDTIEFDDLAYQSKLLILETSLSGELHMLARHLDQLAQGNRHWRDFTFSGLTRGLREVIACFPVYRSYITGEQVSEADRAHIESAIAHALRRNPKTDPAVFQLIQDVLLQRYPATLDEAGKTEWLRFAGKFQQVTSPVTAKGIEDTAFYNDHRLISLNEVGGDPARFGVSPGSLHEYLAGRQAAWPYALSALSTHDTKRSEDVRARINVLSEIPDQWRERLQWWSQLNEPHRRGVGGAVAPHRHDEYLLYQTLIGAWPLEPYDAEEYKWFIERVQAFAVKAMREAKRRSSWSDPDVECESAVTAFVARMLDEHSSGEFLADFRAFQRHVSHLGLFNSLSQTLLKLTVPGVPDTYQGIELWDLSLVDPDNRRPVDYDCRGRMLRGLSASLQNVEADRAGAARKLVSTLCDGRAKLFVTWQTLTLRRERPGLFSSGTYLPAEAAGARREHVFGFVRQQGNAWAVAAVPRLLSKLVRDATDAPLGKDVWGDTVLLLPEAGTPERLVNVFTGETLTVLAHNGPPALPAADAFGHFPVALFVAAT